MSESNGQVAVFHPLFSPKDLEPMLPPPVGKPLQLADDINIAISLLQESINSNKVMMTMMRAMIESMYNFTYVFPPKRKWPTRIFNTVLFIGVLFAITACGVLIGEIVPKWLNR